MRPAGTLKIDQAQFRELESFTKFGGDIDAVTARVIDKGRKNERLLIQPQYQPWAVEDQVAVIYCGVNGLLEKVPIDHVADFEKQYIQQLRAQYPEALNEIAAFVTNCHLVRPCPCMWVWPTTITAMRAALPTNR